MPKPSQKTDTMNPKYANLPKVLDFIFPPRKGVLNKPCFFEVVGYRQPRKGEFYVSGAIPAAYEAPADLENRYIVVRPTYRAKAVRSYVKGKKI